MNWILPIASAAAIVSLILLAFPALAQQPLCGPRDEIVAQLVTKWHETQRAVGMEKSGRLIEVFVSDKGTFTIIISDPSGTSCAATAGEDWQFIDAERPNL